MSLISWNCRGLGNSRTVKALQKVIQREEPILVFLMETKLNKDTTEKVRDQCNFHFSWVVPNEGESGGLALFWKEGLLVEVLDSDQSHIDTVVKGGVSSDWCILLVFMGHWILQGGMSLGLC